MKKKGLKFGISKSFAKDNNDYDMINAAAAEFIDN